MLRVFLALNIFLLNLYSCNTEKNSCKSKVIDLNVIQNKNLSIPLKNNKTLVYSTLRINAEIIKHDPFLNLYLIKSKKNIKHPFKFNKKVSSSKNIVDKKYIFKGKIKKNQVGLNNLATYSKPVFSPALVLSSCCNLEGIVTPKGIIQKEYIENFINSKNNFYSDLGIRVVNKENLVVIQRVNPFDTDNKFKKNDVITHLNSKKITAASIFMKKVLFAKIGTKFKVGIIRNGKKMNFDVVTTKRFGGGSISDTFLEEKGLYFTNNLTITHLGDKYKKYELKVGDRLIQVNGKRVNTIEDIRNNIDDFKDYARLLFLRNGFQFFINIKP